jgi:hypothetical protein
MKKGALTKACRVVTLGVIMGVALAILIQSALVASGKEDERGEEWNTTKPKTCSIESQPYWLTFVSNTSNDYVYVLSPLLDQYFPKHYRIDPGASTAFYFRDEQPLKMTHSTNVDVNVDVKDGSAHGRWLSGLNSQGSWSWVVDSNINRTATILVCGQPLKQSITFTVTNNEGSDPVRVHFRNLAQPEICYPEIDILPGKPGTTITLPDCGEFWEIFIECRGSSASGIYTIP